MNNLNSTKKRLTIIFTLIVFTIVLILWLIFFSAKYYNELRKEKMNFLNSISFVEKEFNVIDKFIKNFNIKRNIFNNIKEGIIKDIRNDKTVSSYIIINKTNNFIISSNIEYNIVPLEWIILDNNEYIWVEVFWFLISKFHIKEKWINYDIVFIQKLTYSFDNYLGDIISYIIVVLFFSVWVYFIWYKFINEALKPVEENMKDMEYFVQNAGHELKTPISIIDSNIQLLDDIKSYDSWFTKEIREEIKRINLLMSWLIELTNINQNKPLDKLNLKNELEKVISWLKSKILEKELNINIKIEKITIIKSNKDYLYIFLSNLIWNAIKYNKKWWKIDIFCKNWTLIIKDSWIWIEDNDLNKIFDRFYKTDFSRNSEGFWIGLSLVKKIENIYKWKIIVKSKKNIWTSFIIKFKK